MTVEITNPYENVDWDSVELRVFVPHMHSEPSASAANTEHHLALDNYIENDIDIDYDAVAFGPKDGESDDTDPFAYPWSTMGERTDFESRDPAELGCCDVPYVEATNHGDHMNCLWVEEKEPIGGSRFDVYETYLSQSEEAMVWPAHTERYIDDRADAPSEYNDDYSHYGVEDVPAWPVSAKTPDHTFWDRDDTDFLWDAWDNLLQEFQPDRPIWGISEDDCSTDKSPSTWDGDEYEGDGFGLRFNLIPMEPEDFDVENDLEGTRQRFRSKILDGQLFPVRRDPWDEPAGEDPSDYPEITAVDVDGCTISIETDGNVEWVSGTDNDGYRNVVETGDTIEVSEDHAPYVRAHVTTGNPEGESSTQPFGVVPPEEPQKVHNATIVSGSIGQS